MGFNEKEVCRPSMHHIISALENASFETIIHMLGQRFIEDAADFSKIIESSILYVTQCSCLTLLKHQRDSLYWGMTLWFISNLHPKSIDERCTKVNQFKTVVNILRYGLESKDFDSLDTLTAISLILRETILQNGDQKHMDQIADKFVTLYQFFEKELVSRPVNNFQDHQTIRRRTVGAQWWFEFQIILSDGTNLSHNFIMAAADALWLSNDARSLKRNNKDNSANVLHFLQEEEFFNKLGSAYDMIDAAMVEYGTTVRAELIASSVAGTNAVFALMERYSGWRYEYDSPFLNRLRDFERKRCLFITTNVLPEVHEILLHWGTEGIGRLKSLSLNINMLFDKRAISSIDANGKIIPPSTKVVILALADIAWWAINSPLIYCQESEKEYLSTTIEKELFNVTEDDLRICASIAALGSKYHIAKLQKYIKNIWPIDRNNADNIDVLALSEAFRVMLETGCSSEILPIITSVRDLLIDCTELTPKDLEKLWVASCWSFRVSIAKTIMRWPNNEFIMPLKEALLESVRRGDCEEEIGVGRFHTTAERALVKLTLGLDLNKERIALYSILNSSSLTFEPIFSIKHDGDILASTAWTTILIIIIIRSNEQKSIINELNFDISAKNGVD